MPAGTERGDHVLDGARIVGAVAVHEHQNICIPGGLGAGKAGASVAWAHGDDFGTGATRYLRRIVGRATVGHDHGINEMARQCRDDGADRLASLSAGITTATLSLAGELWSQPRPCDTACLLIADFVASGFFAPAAKLIFAGA